MASICQQYIIVCLIVLSCDLTFNLCHSTPHTEVNQGLSDLREYLDSRLESFRTDVHRSFQQQLQRIRRAAYVEAEDLEGDLVGHPPLVANITVLEHFFVGLEVYLISGRKRSLDGSFASTAEIRRFDGTNFTTTGEFPTYGLSDIEAFLIGGHIYIAVANQRRDPGLYDGMANIYRFDTTTENVILVQQIFTHGAADFQFFEFEGDGYLALASFQGDGYAKHHTELQVYVFSGAHFDLIATAPTIGATAVTVVEIEWEPYIIVAQYVDNKEQYDIGSIVYKFNADTDTLVKVQTLATNAPKDVEAFDMNGNHYLAVASRGPVGAGWTLDSVIYWWTGVQFIEYQRIPTQNALQCEQMELPNGELLLLFASSEGVTIYEFNTEAVWVPTSTQVSNITRIAGFASIEVIDVPHGLFIVVGESQSVASVYTNGSTNVFQVVASPAAPYVGPVDAIPACLRRAESRLSDISFSVGNFIDKLEGSLKLDGDQEITSKVVFKGKVVADQFLIVDNLNITEEYSFNMERPIIEDGIEIDIQLTTLLPEKDDVVTISGAETIYSPLLFKQPLHSNDTTVHNTYTNDSRFNGIHIQNLNNTLVWLEGDQTIDGLVTLNENVMITNSHLHVQGAINDIDVPGDVMTLNGTQAVRGFLIFTNTTIFFDNLTVDGYVNGLNLSTDVVTTHLDHVISGIKTVGKDLALVEDAIIADGMTVDTVDLSTSESKAVFLTKGGTASGVITFKGQVNIDGRLLSDLVNGINVTELASSVVLIDTTQTIYGDISVEGNFIALSDLNTSYINGVPVSEFVLLDTPGQPISTPVRFAQTLDVQGGIAVTGLLNQIDIPGDIVPIAGSQNVTGQVVFTQNISVVGDIEMTDGATLAGVDISELPSKTVSTSSSLQQIIHGDKNFTRTVDVQGNITIGWFINDVNLTLLQQQILSLTQPQVIDLPGEVRGQLVIRGDLQLVNDTIDGYQLSQDLVRLDDVSNVEGFKIFKDLADISGNLALDPGVNISGVDLPKLNRTVVKLNAVQTIGGEVLIMDNVDMKGNLDIIGLVNGLDISEDVVTLSGNQNITEDIKFESVQVFGDVNISNLTVSSEVNTINLYDLYSGAVMSKGPEVIIRSPVTFDQLEVNNELLVTRTVDGVDVEFFAAEVVTLSGNQTINGTLDFTSHLDFSQNLTVHQNVSRIHFNSLVSSVVLKDTDGPVYGEKRFSSNFSVDGHITVDDLINDINLEILNRTYLSRTINQQLSGLKEFWSNISLDNLDLSTGASINGIIPSTDLVVLTNGGEEINGTLWFSSFLEVYGNMVINQTINDISLSQLHSSVVWLLGAEQTITGPWTLEGGMHVIGDINMEDNMEVNGVDISELADRLANAGQNLTIETPTIFNGSVTIAGNMETLELFDGVNISFIYTDAVRSGPSQTISGNTDFVGDATAQRLEVETNMVSHVITGTANLKHLLDNTVLKSTDQVVVGPVVFTQAVTFNAHVIVNGLIEGIDLSEQAVLKHTDQELTGANVFENGFQVTGDIMAGLIDTVDVPLLARSVVLIDTYQVIQGVWSFRSNVTVNNDTALQGTVNGIDIGGTLVTLTGTHEITGSKAFSNNVIVHGDLLVGLVNGVNLTEFEKEIVHLIGDFTITGDKLFFGTVTLLDNATVVGLVDGIDIPQMYPDHQATAEWLHGQIPELNATLRSMCQAIASLQIAVLGQAVQLSHWEEEYQLNNSFATYRYDSLNIEDGLLIAFAESSEATMDDCIKTTLYLCTNDERDGCFDVHNESLSAAASVELFDFEGDIFIVLTLSHQSSYCTGITASDDEVQILQMSNETYDVRLPAQHPIDTAMFVIDGTLYLAVANQYNRSTGDKNIFSAVFEYNPATKDFTELQEIATIGSTAVAYLEYSGSSWLAFTCDHGTTYSLIMIWNATIHQFVLEASILTYSASDVLGMVIDGVPLMAFANEKQLSGHGTVDLNQPISIYEYSVKLGWTLKQDVDAVGIMQLDRFLIDTISYLVAVSSRGAIDIYKWSGASQFVFHKSLPVDGVASVHPFVHWGDLHMAIARPAFHSIITEESRAFAKAIIRGKNKYTVLEA